MLWNSLLKKPILVLGVLMMAAFLMDLRNRGEWLFSREKLMPTSCKAVLVKLEKRIPASWQATCEQKGHNLFVQTLLKYSAKSEQELKKAVYRELANNMSFVAKNSPEETLSRVMIVRFQINHPKMTVEAISEGKMVAKLKTLSTQKHIREHLRASVQVKETMK